MTHRDVIDKTISFVKLHLSRTESGHDWWHTYRVWKMAKKIGENYQTNNTLLDLGALLHDIADSKFHEGNEDIGPSLAFDFLISNNIDKEIIDKVVLIIKNISYKNKGQEKPDFIEFKIIQDADRLDAIGAIGIARALNYGGFKNRKIYDPDIKPAENLTNKEYKKSNGPTINHFYEKLLKIKDLLNTPEALAVAEQRHTFMKQYLNRFFIEWNGQDF